MNYVELLKWAEDNSKINNASLILGGVKSDKITKTRAYLRAIIDRCKIVISNNEKNNKYTKDIEEYSKELTKIGIMSKKPDVAGTNIDEKIYKGSNDIATGKSTH